MVTVYRFGRYDIQKDETVWSRRMATKEAIERISGGSMTDGFFIDPGSATEVDKSDLDPREPGMTVLPKGETTATPLSDYA
jgi:hypothetical protein